MPNCVLQRWVRHCASLWQAKAIGDGCDICPAGAAVTAGAGVAAAVGYGCGCGCCCGYGCG